MGLEIFNKQEIKILHEFIGSQDLDDTESLINKNGLTLDALKVEDLMYKLYLEIGRAYNGKDI